MAALSVVFAGFVGLVFWFGLLVAFWFLEFFFVLFFGGFFSFVLGFFNVIPCKFRAHRR